MPSGSLTVVGTGIQLGTHLTREATLLLEKADIVLCVVAEPAMQSVLERLNPETRSLHDLYELGENRGEAY
jgi:precorrin-3B methylase